MLETDVSLHGIRVSGCSTVRTAPVHVYGLVFCDIRAHSGCLTSVSARMLMLGNCSTSACNSSEML